MLRRWWTEKYKLPWTPSNVGDFTVLDLLTEFYEDVFENDKTALYEASRGEDGEIMFESTGDDLIDKWEKELAMGIEPDLTEGMSDKERAALITEKAKAEKAVRQAAQISDIDEKYNVGLQANPMYANKTAGGDLLGHSESRGLSPLDLLNKGR